MTWISCKQKLKNRLQKKEYEKMTTNNQIEQHADPIDIGADITQRERDNAVAHIQSLVKPIPTSDTCLQCEKETLNGARFCNSSCRDDWQAWNPGV
jgi:cobalamin-dependent methionine synthase I